MENRATPLEQSLQHENVKLRKINRVLMDRVERSTDWQGNAFSLFQAAIVLEGRVEERSVQLEAALRQVEAASQRLTQTQEQMDKAQTHLREAIDTISEGFALFDSDDRLVLWNDKFTDLLELLGQDVYAKMPFSQVIQQAVANCAVFDALGRESQWINDRIAHHNNPNRPFVYRLTDGRWIQVNERRTPEGATVAVYTDITEIKELEERRREVLLQAKKAAEQANVSKTKFLAAASHDLLQPLNAARLFTAAFAERGGMDKPALDLLHGIEHALDDIDSLLRTLFDISKLDAGVMVTEITQAPIAILLDQLTREYAPQAQQVGLELRMVPCSATITSDFKLLARILRNLLSNAIRYTEQGRILLGCRRKGNRLRIEIWDTGIGIPPEKLSCIFEEFQQIHTPGRQTERGMGLGLAIVDRIARLLKHKVAVDSQPGKGSHFAITLPATFGSKRVEPPVAPPPSSNTVSLQGGNFLAIDDDQGGLEALCALLRAWGADVFAVGTQESLDQWLNSNPGKDWVVVADYHLWGQTTGLNVISRLRECLGNQLPAMIVTSDHDPALRSLVRGQGVPILNKPIAPAKLRSVITHLTTQQKRAAG